MMQNLSAMLAALLVASAGAARALSQERPVMKVVRMLQDMKTELQRDLDDDKAVHEKLDCWCKTNDREKTQAIATGEARSSQLEAFIGEAKAKMQEIKTKREATQDEVDSDWAALNKASALRMKENTEFHGEETHLQEAIQAADEAIVVLSAHHPELAQVRAAAHRLRQVGVLSMGSLSGEKAEALKAFLSEQPEGQQAAEGTASFLGIPGFQSYRPQSGQIFGILKQMKEDFEKNLDDVQKREAKDVSDFQALKAAKEEEIAVGKKSVAQLDQEFADFGEKSAQAFQELEDTQKQLELDRAFLGDLKKKCAQSDAEFEARVKSRLEEIAAVDDTIKILNEDTSFDLFSKTVNTPSFLQTASGLSQREELARRQRASSVLTLAASRMRSPRLSLLAAKAQLDAFVKIKEEIDKMVAELQTQQKDEVDHRDWCIKEMHENNRSTEAAYDKKANLEAKIADLEKSIESLSRSIETTTKEIADMQEQMKRASETREAENADCQQTVTDQRLTQTILKKALSRMKEVYAFMQEEPQPGAAHTALSGNHTSAGNGPARFTKYEQHKGGSRVVTMLETIINDSVTAEDEAIKSEEDAQIAYEDFMKQSNTMITAGQKKIADMSGARAQAKEDLVMAKTDLKDTVGELEDLHNTMGNLHKSCDFVLDNFDARQAARAAEVEALKEAKAILSGMQ
uniref:Uncharacterized protein n=1 Tax=Alexandrium monilatum TaxID=311494 RepID=A0A7S4T0S7_9DINO